ncbi:sodium- and chloride-dependent GABA transporter 2-like [Pollicipes pollicipes]|uniref:sodium- and chloride-dependent GABA transporter 2-like n=1 Tax=Pollicipes pollicipes TaxID=41117 RepID=UPI0018849425|nr:sodium- and chloride-dependent GABA transporter 2-like [Pollicipes pollicipes]
MTVAVEKVQNGGSWELDVDQKCEPQKTEPRGQWSSQMDFILSIVGYAVGLGNFWRFPYLCYKNGGGAFLVPYLITLLVAGLPLLCMELTIGQYTNLGPSMLFQNLSPLFAGVGYGMVMVSFLVVCYYNLIMTWTIFYTVASFRSTLGWSSCANDYNTENCFTLAEEQACLNQTGGTDLFWNKTCYPIDAFCAQNNFTLFNATHCSSNVNSSLLKAYGDIGHRISASEDYFTNYVLGLLDHSWEDYGTLKWDLCLCLLAAWLIVGLCLMKGVKSSGKVVYFTAVFPYVVLIILLVRGVTLEGAADGMAYYMTPNMSRLTESRVWADAATQIFYSFGLSFGGVITLASYNRFDNNCMRDAIFVGFTNCGTSVLAGFVVFSVLGFMAKRLGKKVSEVVVSGSGLTFIAYPEAVVHMPVAPVWAVLFFFMIITLGLDSQFAMVETVLTAVYDQWPHLRSRKAAVVSVASILGFLLSISMCANGGIHLFTLMDWYSGSWSLMVLALLEVLVVAWAFGADRVLTLMEVEMGIRIPRLLRWYWYIMWKYITPVVVVGILAFSVVQYQPAYYGSGEAKQVYPVWVNALGWLMSVAPIILVPAFAVAYLCGSRRQGLRAGLQPTPLWRPAGKRASVAAAQELNESTLPSADAAADNTQGEANAGYVPDPAVVVHLSNGSHEPK